MLKDMSCPSGRPSLRPHYGLSRITILTKITELAGRGRFADDMDSGELNARSPLGPADTIVKTPLHVS
jgi:hypothetical protein